MKLSPGLKNFWVQVGLIIWQSLLIGLVIAFLITPLVIQWFIGWETRISFVVWGLLVAIIVATVVAGVWLAQFLGELKPKMLAGLSGEWNIIPNVIAESYAWLDLDKLGRETNALEVLGFIQLMDYELLAQSPVFGRCFSHPEHDCFAEIGQSLRSGSEINNFSPPVISRLEQDWIWSTSNGNFKTIECISYMWRNPKSVFIRYPNLDLAGVFQAHLTFRRQMIADLGIAIVPDVSWNAYQTFQQKSAQLRRKTFQNRLLLLAMIEATLYNLNPSLKWLGDYPKAVARRRAASRQT